MIFGAAKPCGLGGLGSSRLGNLLFHDQLVIAVVAFRSTYVMHPIFMIAV